MTPFPLPPSEAKARSWAKIIAIIGGALIGLIGPAITAYKLATYEAKEAAAKVETKTAELAAKVKVDNQGTKNEAEAGYQVLKTELETLRAEKAERERLAKKGKPQRHVHPAAPVQKALPSDLKKAEQVVSAGVSPVPVNVSVTASNPDAQPKETK